MQVVRSCPNSDFSVQPLCSLCLCGSDWLGKSPRRHREHRGCTEKNSDQDTTWSGAFLAFPNSSTLGFPGLRLALINRLALRTRNLMTTVKCIRCGVVNVGT